MHNDVLSALTKINKVLLQDMSLEREELDNYPDNESDILTETYNYHKGKDDAYFELSILINRLMAEELMNGVKDGETITEFGNGEGL